MKQEINTNYTREFSSSLLKNAIYTPETQELKIVFFNDTTYSYENVPEEVVKEFFAAESHGKYFIKNIRYKYKFNKL